MTSDTSPRPVSPLRARMIEDMNVRGFSEQTRSHYIRHVRSFAAFIGRSPDTATAEDLRRFQLHQVPMRPRSNACPGTTTASSPPRRGTSTRPPTDLRDNTRLFLPPTVFNRFAVTREINDGLLAPRFAPSQRAWILIGFQVPVTPALDASAGRDADDR
jgi:hypothetical protein